MSTSLCFYFKLVGLSVSQCKTLVRSIEPIKPNVYRIIPTNIG